MKTSSTGIPTTRGEAHGKAIIVGEHAVVYGAEALAVPIKSMWFTVHLEVGTSTKVTVSGQDCTAELASLLEEAQVMFDFQDLRFNMRAETNIPMAAGLGSSAALAISILRAFGSKANKPLENKELARLGNILEAKFHGTPSGLDAAVVAFNSPILFRKGEGAFSLNLAESFPGRLFLIHSGEQASTRVMVEKARPYFMSSDGPRIISEFNSLAREASYGLQSSNLEAVGHAMSGAHAHLLKAGVVSERQRHIIETCVEFGAASAKITGAGGGGSVIALFGADWDGKKELESRLCANLLEVYL